MIPSLVADEVKQTLVEYLTAAFSFNDRDVRGALTGFLTGPDGIFRGPYLRVKTPLQQVDASWKSPLEWMPKGFCPYTHQADAFERLSTAEGAAPEPTIVTSGTGSGKTECFLYPVLDHCARMRARGALGVKALLIYPMNALANDQAERLAGLIHKHPELEGVTAGLYVGGAGNHQAMGPNHLVTDRHVLRDTPPDILLTNYKMLDFLLLRSKDRQLWAANEPHTLQYVVLDEFHTYDGAQGSDVAMLLRRLGRTLKMSVPGQPLGTAVPVATSATLGGGEGATEELCEFASKVFGCEIDSTAVLTEQLQPLEQACDPIDFRLPIPEPAELQSINDRDDLAAAFCHIDVPVSTGQPSAPAVSSTGRSSSPPVSSTGRSPSPPVSSTAYPSNPEFLSSSHSSSSTFSSSDHPDTPASSSVAHPSAATLPGSPDIAFSTTNENEEADRRLELGKVLLKHPLTQAVLKAVGDQPRHWDDAVTEVNTRAPNWGRAHMFDPDSVAEALAKFLWLLSEARRGDPANPRPLFDVQVQLWVREMRRVLRDVQHKPNFRWSDITTKNPSSEVTDPAAGAGDLASGSAPDMTTGGLVSERREPVTNDQMSEPSDPFDAHKPLANRSEPAAGDLASEIASVLTTGDLVSDGRESAADDRVSEESDSAAGAGELARVAAPAVFCRRCGASGWMAQVGQIEPSKLRTNSFQVRRAAALGEATVRAVLRCQPDVEGVRYWDITDSVLKDEPSPHTVPVLVTPDDEAATRSTCPACGERQSIRFLGLRVASQASVAVSALFGSTHVNSDDPYQPDERKVIAFTDSVQDASHRAAFISARTWRFDYRLLLQKEISEVGDISLAELGSRMAEQADSLRKRYAQVPPDLLADQLVATTWTDTPDPAGLERLQQRLEFEAHLEFGLRSRVGRTLELSGTAAAMVEAAELQQVHDLIAEWIANHAPSQLSLTTNTPAGDGGVSADSITKVGDAPSDDHTKVGDAPSDDHTKISDAPGNDDAVVNGGVAGGTAGGNSAISVYVRGLLERLRLQGGIQHPFLETYARLGRRWHIWGGRPAGLPAFPRGFAAPAFFTTAATKSRSQAFSDFDSLNTTAGLTWLVDWAFKTLGLTSKTTAAKLNRFALLVLAASTELVDEVAVDGASRGGYVYGLSPEQVRVFAVEEDAPSRLVCDVCGFSHVVPEQWHRSWQDTPCLRYRCRGQFQPHHQPDQQGYYQHLYRSGQPRRIVTAEHTSLLEQDERVEIEQDFKLGEVPGAPNVIVATPTLEMGIDIGDLSAVMLTSVPSNPVHYIQRLGRAGRASGNSVGFTFVPTNAKGLYYLEQPEAMINGEIRTPNCYLDAPETLRRQYNAYLLDRKADQTLKPTQSDQKATAPQKQTPEHRDHDQQTNAERDGPDHPQRRTPKRWSTKTNNPQKHPPETKESDPLTNLERDQADHPQRRTPKGWSAKVSDDKGRAGGVSDDKGRAGGVSDDKGWAGGSASCHIAERSGAVTRNEPPAHPHQQSNTEDPPPKPTPQDHPKPTPRRMYDLMHKGFSEGTTLREIVDASINNVAHRQEFLELFGDKIRPESVAMLEEYASGGIESALKEATETWMDSYRELKKRHERLTRAIARHEKSLSAGGSNDPILSDLQGQRAAIGQLMRERRDEYVLSGLERLGVLPNYTLFDDTVSLETAIWATDTTGDHQVNRQQYRRSGAQAIREFAPGNKFYVSRHRHKINALEVGPADAPSYQDWRLCPECGHATPEDQKDQIEQSPYQVEQSSDSPATGESMTLASSRYPYQVEHPSDSPATHRYPPDATHTTHTGTIRQKHCPRCRTDWSDTGNKHRLLKLTTARASGSEESTRVYDERDVRDQNHYELITSVDVDPNQVAGAWLLSGKTFGAEYARQVDIRYLNFGPAQSKGTKVRVHGHDCLAPKFHVCGSCGRVPVNAEERQLIEDGDPAAATLHEGWCKVRSGAASAKDAWLKLGLYHELITDAVRVLLPVSTFEVEARLATFEAALKLGLRRDFGGDPQHLAILPAQMPIPSDHRSSNSRTGSNTGSNFNRRTSSDTGSNSEDSDSDAVGRFLVLYDRVPGGTGYLDRLADPERMRKILGYAREEISSCPCALQGHQACHRCLLGVVGSYQYDLVGRQLALELLDDLLEGWHDSTDQDDHDDGSTSVTSVATVGDTSAVEIIKSITELERSELERRFVAALQAWADTHEGVAMSPAVVGHAGTKSWEISFSSAHKTLRYRMDEQRLLHGSLYTKPDFLIVRENDRSPEVAVYLDGYTFHAAPEHCIVAEDARKRSSVRASGRWVWSLTFNDVKSFHEAMSSDPPRKPKFTPLIRGKAKDNARKLAHSRPSKPSDTTPAVETLENHPMAMLLEYLQHPESSNGGVWHELASLLVLGHFTEQFASGGQSWLRSHQVRTALEAAAKGEKFKASTLETSTSDRSGSGRSDGSGSGRSGRSEVQQQIQKSDVCAASWLDQRGLRVSAFIRTEDLPENQWRWTVIAALNDSSEAINDPKHRGRWRSWLHWSNVLQFLGPPTNHTCAWIAATSQAQEELSDLLLWGISQEALKIGNESG